MKVLLVNGSPHKNGCTFTALSEVEKSLNENGIDTMIYHIGHDPVRGCISCGRCYTTGLCVFTDDPCNELIQLMIEADGIIIGSPVFYAGPNGALLAILDRVFFAGSNKFMDKPAAAVVNCRRGGASAAFDRLNKYFTINNMQVVTSQYWNSTHGLTPDEVRSDLEGMQIMRTLGKNMAWLLSAVQTGNVPLPKREDPIMTNFIR